MSILIDSDTRLCVSGITGREGTFHALNNKKYGTNVVSGVTPGKAGQQVDGIPVYNTFSNAVKETDANTAMVFVPARFAADSVLEASARTLLVREPLETSEDEPVVAALRESAAEVIGSRPPLSGAHARPVSEQSPGR